MTLTNCKEFPNFPMSELPLPSDLPDDSPFSAETEAFLAECHDRIVKKSTIQKAINLTKEYYWNTIMLMCGSALKKFIHPLGDDATERLALSVARTLWEHEVKIKSPMGEFIDPSDPAAALERRRGYRRAHITRGFDNDPKLSEEEETFVAAKVADICGRIDSGVFKLSTDHGLIVSIGRNLKGLEGTGEFKNDRFYILRDTIVARVCVHCTAKGIILKKKSQGRSSDPKTVEQIVPVASDTGGVPDFSPLSSDDSDADGLHSDALQDNEDDELVEYDDDELLGIDPSSPAKAIPGSEAKVLMLAARYAAGQPLWHAGDYRQHGPTADREKEMATKRNEREAAVLDERMEGAIGGEW